MPKKDITFGTVMAATIAAFPFFYLTMKFENADLMIAAVVMAAVSVGLFGSVLNSYAVLPILSNITLEEYEAAVRRGQENRST
jgi:hypothetical protein